MVKRYTDTLLGFLVEYFNEVSRYSGPLQEE